MEKTTLPWNKNQNKKNGPLKQSRAFNGPAILQFSPFKFLRHLLIQESVKLVSCGRLM